MYPGGRRSQFLLSLVYYRYIDVSTRIVMIDMKKIIQVIIKCHHDDPNKKKFIIENLIDRYRNSTKKKFNLEN